MTGYVMELPPRFSPEEPFVTVSPSYARSSFCSYPVIVENAPGIHQEACMTKHGEAS